MKICVFFAGTGSDTNRRKFEYREWVNKFTQKDYFSTAIDGVGTGETKLKNKYKSLTGKGWANKVQEGFDYVDNRLNNDIVLDNNPVIVSIGHSRGGVEAVVFANCVAKAYPLARQIVIALDPVPGGLTGTTTSFEMSPNRNVLGRAWGTITGGRSRDRLREKHQLSHEAWKEVPSQVVVYCSLICQWHSRQRNTSGFTPQMQSRGTLKFSGHTRHFEWAIPGDHTDVVAFGVDPKPQDRVLKRGAVHTKVDHRQLRRIIVEDMIDYALQKADLGAVFCHPPADVLRNYNAVAEADLKGDQAGKQTGFSFTKNARTVAVRGGNINEIWNQGSREHFSFVRPLSWNLKGFVNERHFEIANSQLKLQNQEAVDFFKNIIVPNNTH